MPRVSVIMSSYNDSKFVKESVVSILKQTFTDFEFIIIDDGSNDGTWEILRQIRDERIILFRNEVNKGFFENWSRSVSVAKGQFICFQDSDDLSYPDRLEVLAGAMLADSTLAACGANFSRTFWTGKRLISDYPLRKEDIIEQAVQNGKVPFIRGMFRRDAFLSLGGFRDYFKGKGWEDNDFFLRVAENFKVVNLPNVLYEYRYRRNSSSKLTTDLIDIEKIFINEIGLYLFNQRLENNGMDALMSNNLKKELSLFVKDLSCDSITLNELLFERVIKSRSANYDIYGILMMYFQSKLSLKRFNKISLYMMRTVLKIILWR